MLASSSSPPEALSAGGNAGTLFCLPSQNPLAGSPPALTRRQLRRNRFSCGPRYTPDATRLAPRTNHLKHALVLRTGSPTAKFRIGCMTP
jgi:hypothetical protein